LGYDASGGKKQEGDSLNRDECPERIRLTDRYCRAITEFNVRLDALARAPSEANQIAAEAAKALSQTEWDGVTSHIAQHKCMPLSWPGPGRGALEAAAMHALDVIMVADDQRRFVDVNEAAAKALGMPREEIIGRSVDDFFLWIQGETVPEAWAKFVVEGVQAGVCELISPPHRRYAYRAKANFAPGFHLGILREIE
jgi:PAS domain-containing protein